MKHFTCDVCGRAIAQERYVARIEVAAAFDPEQLDEMNADSDHLEQIADEIAELDDTAQFSLPETGPKTFEFDLCATCQRRFVRDPLPRLTRTPLKFSPN